MQLKSNFLNNVLKIEKLFKMPNNFLVCSAACKSL